ncbi:nucleotidyltransferase family protein [Rhodopirellula baltica]|uniref:Sugar-phosphate nucleotide transferase n=1 Tax=Rhodopirellula baltica WH47 TaxID=991778 RepID=F2ALQ7_RHOBT|nr:nucleotidyltransferase family protein [Rhodopirellula baltica]EGF29403.1 sugar-phosphate nucleotide transferase [Rhodopirellula baltica WH47]
MKTKETTIDTSTDLTGVCVTASSSILEAMKVIDSGAAQIAIVVDNESRVTGVITDGDLRRGILRGAGLHDSVESLVRTKFRSVPEGTTRSEALDLIQAFGVSQLPVIDQSGRLCGLHSLNRIIQPQQLPNVAMILAGGKGTRLGTLTKSLPKPMLRVAGRPIIERILLHLIGNGIRRIFISVNYLAETIEDHFGDGSDFGCRISYLREDEPLGTGGSLALLPNDEITAPIIVMNGDLVTDFSVPGLLRTHSKAGNQITVGVRNYHHSIPFGCMKLEGDRVIDLIEKPTHTETINAGIYVLSPSVIASVPLAFCPMTDVLATAINDGNRVGVFEVDEWIDVGLPSQLAEARGQN